MTVDARHDESQTGRHVAVEQLVDRLNEVLKAHAGGLELQTVGTEGELSLRFTGMCTGCPLRPVTFSGLVKPALMALDGVESVSADGVRLSAEAEARLARHMRVAGSERILAALGAGEKRGR